MLFFKFIHLFGFIESQLRCEDFSLGAVHGLRGPAACGTLVS